MCLLLAPALLQSLCLPASGSASSQGGIWRQGTRVYSALCEMSARGCKQCVVLLRESTELHWQHFPWEMERAGNLLAWRAGLLGAAAVGGKSLCGAHVTNN